MSSPNSMQHCSDSILMLQCTPVSLHNKSVTKCFLTYFQLFKCLTPCNLIQWNSRINTQFSFPKWSNLSSRKIPLNQSKVQKNMFSIMQQSPPKAFYPLQYVISHLNCSSLRLCEITVIGFSNKVKSVLDTAIWELFYFFIFRKNRTKRVNLTTFTMRTFQNIV